MGWRNCSTAAFTILELLVAIFVFGLVLTAIYSIWVGILRGTKAALTAAAEVQRSRIAIRALEDALLTAVMFNDNMRYYGFQADTSGDMAYLSMVSRLPASFPGVGRYGQGGLVVRRVTFSVESGSDGKNELVMSQAPMLLATNGTDAQPYNLALAKDVTEFTLQFYDLQKKEWMDEWRQTNQLPRLVKVTLGLGTTGSGYATKAHDVVTRVVALPAMPVAGAQGQVAPPAQPGLTNRVGQPGTVTPQPGFPQPGIQPGVRPSPFDQRRFP
jgi:hypothetical protein